MQLLDGSGLMRNARRWLALSLVAPAGVLAQPANMTLGEVALTPPVCQDVQALPTGWTQWSRESPRSPYWISIMGHSFWDMHHYCWALIHLNRAQQVGQPRHHRAHMVRTAISDFYYVVKKAKPDFVLLPELYYRIGDAHILLGEFAQAVAAFDRSKSIKPDYWPPYVGHARVLETLGKREDARLVIANGLRQMPDEPELLEAYRRLGGNPKDLPKSSPPPRKVDQPALGASAPQ